MNNALTSKAEYTSEQVQLIKNTVAVGATDDELKLFLTVCNNHKLDPFTRQIHFVKRAGKGTIQISIDGFRAIAERTGVYAGNDDPVFDSEQKPQKATVTVWKMVEGQRCPFSATARWAQYYPGKGQGFMWDKMPHLMLGKTAEALALRKAFPEAMSGLYSDEEMEQAGETIKAEPIVIPADTLKEGEKFEIEVYGTVPVKEVAVVAHATGEQLIQIGELCKKAGTTAQKVYESAKIKGNPTQKQAKDLIDAMTKRLDEKAAKIDMEQQGLPPLQ